MGDPHRRFRSLHVAGTNGKGSVVATLSAVLRASGYRTGMYTSPHLVDFRERILVDGEPISEERVVRFADEMLSECDRIGATFFEATTALAFADFAERDVDIAVVETGLGGRLDSTNVLLPEVAAVTSVALDHTDLLGTTLPDIASEKAGIFKRGVPAVIGEADQAIAAELVARALRAGAAGVSDVRREWKLDNVAVHADGTSFDIGHRAIRGRFRTALIGEHQAVNAVMALAILAAGGLLPDAATVAGGLASVRLAGRFQRHGPFIFDVAHNRSAAAMLAATIERTRPARPILGLVGILADKDWPAVLAELAPVLDRVICTVPPSAPVERRWDPAAAAAAARDLAVQAEAIPDFDAALELAASADGTVVVTGSFHTVGDAMYRLQVNPLAT